ncbi:DUF4179 domain-containing protein [Clostridium sp.]|uniref:DUF4179 domain-containing protein n=1 Tax=Clostridium sp. TaxID=1506 RepID=UPI0028503A55|nr:DUF4179 domain-containing protein [Clostridium sp.]MDR3597601.1 DUF4179 domain-containing protein [Clostridium sp.]
MQVNDDLFDDKIKQKLKYEINYIPDDINQKIDDAVKKIEKRRFNVKKVCSICACCVGITLFLGMAMPTYASNIPIIGSIFKMFNYKTYENYDKYASDLNITKESNGVKMTINKVVYDEIELAVFYSIESENEIKFEPRFPGAELKINGKTTTFSGGGPGKFSDDHKTYVGVMEYNVSKKNSVPKEVQEKTLLGGYVEIPDEFVFTLNINEIGTPDDSNSIKGKWNFNIPVNSEKIIGKVNEKECDIDLSNIASGYNIKKIITTPLNTVIQGTRMDEEDNSDDINFDVFDDKGRYIEGKSSEAIGHKDNDGNCIMYFNNNFKEIYDDTKSLTFIPYKYKFIGNDNSENNENSNEITAKINFKGETKLYSNDGTEYAVITKIQKENGKTKIYYKSEYGISIGPIEILNNKTGENIVSFNTEYSGLDQKEATTYDYNSNEYVITCDKEITEGDYSIKTVDQSKSIETYNNDKFTINIK